MTTTADTRPDWLRQKHSGQPVNPRRAGWADQTLDVLYGMWDHPEPIGPFRSQQAAQAAKNALYDAAYKRWNRRHPDEQLSLSANITNPGDSKCYARGACRCEQNGCRPTPGPGLYIHARLYDKAQGRAHQGGKPREQWDYDPMLPRTPAAQQQAERPFGGGRRQAEDDPPAAGLSRPGTPKAQPKAAAKPAATDETETLAAKIRRWAG